MDVTLNKRVMVALDVQGREEALALAKALQGSGCWLKVGMELYAYTGPTMIPELKAMGFPIFLDLKLQNPQRLRSFLMKLRLK